jgi:hypothetical protein
MITDATITMVDGSSATKASPPPSLVNTPRSDRPIRIKISDSSTKTTMPQTASDRVRVMADSTSCCCHPMIMPHATVDRTPETPSFSAAM